LKGIKISDKHATELNNARMEFYLSKIILSVANKLPNIFSKSEAMADLNRRRAELRKIAHEMRSKMLANKENEDTT